MLSVDNINLSFTEDALKEVARIAEYENENDENIGARRLHTILELLLEDISFNADGSHPMLDVVINKEYVEKVYKESGLKNSKKKIPLGFNVLNE